MPELRFDPLTGRKALIAAERADRPQDFAPQADTCARDAELRRETCPFCAGREAATPLALLTLPAPPQAWQVRVVPNKFPAIDFRDDPRHTARGAHEVVIESPRHVSDWTQLEAYELASVLEVHRARLRHWAVGHGMEHAMIFKNSGPAAGASLEHVHSQLVAVPFVLDAVVVELEGAQRLATRLEPCWFCAELQRQAASRERWVDSEGPWTAFCPPAPRQPFETWVLPHNHMARFDATQPETFVQASALLQRVIRAIQMLSGGTAYNLLLHSAPFSTDCLTYYHWHWEIVPRLNCLAGLELGGGVYVNSVSPEQAAALLRNELADRNCEKRR